MGDSPWDLDEKLLSFFSKNNIRDGFYIEAGAVNGVWQSNTLLLENKLNWTGLLIEPDHSLYTECLKYRANNLIYNAALVDFEYHLEHVQGTFTDSIHNYELALQGQINYKNPDFNIKPGAQLLTAPARTLSFILQHFNIKREIGLLSLDVEGSEFQALDGLNLKINRPKYIIIETTSSEKKRERISNYLNNFNYTFLEQMTPNDAFYVDKDSNENL